MPAGAAHPVASGTGDVQAFTGSGRLRGYSFRENAGVAGAATVILRDGTTATDPILAVIELAGDSSETALLDVTVTDGVFVDRVAGTTEGVVYVG